MITNEVIMINENKYLDFEEEISGNELNDLPDSYSPERDFTTLEAWRKARQLRLFLYKEVIPYLPAEEKYASGSQIRRAALSVTNNIAEGFGRFHFQEGIQFYRISRGSLYELKDDLIFCLDNNYIDRDKYDQGIKLLEDAKITLNGYINYVVNKKKV